jgi:hypothetical protein
MRNIQTYIIDTEKRREIWLTCNNEFMSVLKYVYMPYKCFYSKHIDLEMNIEEDGKLSRVCYKRNKKYYSCEYVNLPHNIACSQYGIYLGNARLRYSRWTRTYIIGIYWKLIFCWNYAHHGPAYLLWRKINSSKLWYSHLSRHHSMVQTWYVLPFIQIFSIRNIIQIYRILWWDRIAW